MRFGSGEWIVKRTYDSERFRKTDHWPTEYLGMPVETTARKPYAITAETVEVATWQKEQRFARRFSDRNEALAAAMGEHRSAEGAQRDATYKVVRLLSRGEKENRAREKRLLEVDTARIEAEKQWREEDRQRAAELHQRAMKPVEPWKLPKAPEVEAMEKRGFALMERLVAAAERYVGRLQESSDADETGREHTINEINARAAKGTTP